jgi:hypothetical protein
MLANLGFVTESFLKLSKPMDFLSSGVMLYLVSSSLARSISVSICLEIEEEEDA